jgi:hypothetical protein
MMQSFLPVNSSKVLFTSLVFSVGGMTPGRVKRLERYKEYG